MPVVWGTAVCRGPPTGIDDDLINLICLDLRLPLGRDDDMWSSAITVGFEQHGASRSIRRGECSGVWLLVSVAADCNSP